MTVTLAALIVAIGPAASLTDAIGVAAGRFPGTPAVTAALVFGLFQTFVLALVALGWGRLATAAPESMSS